MRKHTIWHVLPRKTQISLHICTVWSVFIVHTKKLCILGISAPIKDSDQTVNAQVDLNLHWARMSKSEFTLGTFSDTRAHLWMLGGTDANDKDITTASNVRKCSLWHVCPAKTQIGSNMHLIRLHDYVDVQADLTLHWVQVIQDIFLHCGSLLQIHEYRSNRPI